LPLFEKLPPPPPPPPQKKRVPSFKKKSRLPRRDGTDRRGRFPTHFARVKHERRWSREGETKVSFFTRSRVGVWRSDVRSLLRRIPGRRSPFWDRAGLFWVESHLETSGKDGTRLARATVLGAAGIFARANASRSSPLDARDAREAAQKAMSFFRFFLKTQKGPPKKGRAFMTPRACRVPRAKRFVYSPRDKRVFFSRHATGHVLSHENQRHRS